ncbi:MAG TPA: SDR family oxidoreductase, partial [Bdellovibrionota bacterium]|nr:SDR family oxidoreductase [Bdellovibrionota bacterium]
MTAQRHELKTVIITGGGSGIGLETAKLLLETGEYRLALVGRDRTKLEEAQKVLGSHDVVAIYPCDLRDPAQVRKAGERILGVHSTIYGLVNNAGVYPFGGIDNTTEQAWDEAMTVNLKAPFLFIQSVAEGMRRSQNGARIVNVSSTAGILPNHFALAYSVSKAAMIQLTRTLAKEMGKDGITVNCVCPGIVKTPLHDAYHNTAGELEQFYAKRGATFPLGRVGEPKDVAGAIRYFLSPDAAWVTG